MTTTKHQNVDERGKQAKHTPGPWIVFHRKGHFYVEAPGSNPSSRVMVCTIHETSVSIDQTTRAEYDAKLIAAAPDLMEELQKLIQAWDIDPDGRIGVARVNDARLAIVRATSGN